MRKRTEYLIAVDSMTVHELVLMHWEFTMCRALFKPDGEFFWEVIIERTELSHISNGLRECRAGFLDRLVSLYRAASTIWYAEMACLGLELGQDVSDENHLIEFINFATEGSETFVKTITELLLKTLLDYWTCIKQEQCAPRRRRIPFFPLSGKGCH